MRAAVITFQNKVVLSSSISSLENGKALLKLMGHPVLMVKISRRNIMVSNSFSEIKDAVLK